MERNILNLYDFKLIIITYIISNLYMFNPCVRDRGNTTMVASVAQLDAPSDWRPGRRGFNLRQGRQHSFVEIDHEIFSTVILSLPLIQEGQLSFLAKECAQYRLTA